jgi:hypothetical protein
MKNIKIQVWTILSPTKNIATERLGIIFSQKASRTVCALVPGSPFFVIIRRVHVLQLFYKGWYGFAGQLSYPNSHFPFLSYRDSSSNSRDFSYLCFIMPAANPDDEFDTGRAALVSLTATIDKVPVCPKTTDLHFKLVNQLGD